MSKRVVQFERTLDEVKSKRKKDAGPKYRKGDILVREYCASHPLTLPEGVEVHQIFYPKGVAQPDDMRRLFSDGLPKKGLTSLKSILYGHVTSPQTDGLRYENFTQLTDENIMSLREEIIDMVDDPFWKSVEQRQKFGSYAWHGYASLIDNINKQYSTHGQNDVPDWVTYGINAAINELPDEIDILSLEESIAYCRTDTNSGFPCFTSQPFIELNEEGTSFNILNEEVYNIYHAIATQVWEGKAHTNLPAVLFKRIQPGEGTNSKVRIVECISRGILWAESRFWRPMLEHMRGVPAYAGYMHYSNGMSDIIEQALGKSHVSSLDYTSYDAIAGKYLPELFLALAVKYPSAAPLLLWCAEYYRMCPLLTPHGWIQGEHGLFSGMFGTSFAGSLLNRGFILGMEYAINVQRVRGDVNITEPVHLAFGDDTVYAWEGNATIDDIIEVLNSAGLQLNKDKQEYCGVGDNDVFVMFQACYWRSNIGCDDHCVPVYPLVRCAARLAFVEHLDINSKLIYGAGRRVNDVECPTVVGPIITAFIAKLLEAKHHPFILRFCSTYQGSWCHYMNPLLCVTKERVLRFIKSELGFIDDTDGEEFLKNPICEHLINGLKLVTPLERRLMSKDELIEEFTSRTTGNSHGNKSSTGEDDISTVDLMRSLNENNFSEGLIDSVLLHLPKEALCQ